MCNIIIKNYQCNENIKSNVSYNVSTISQKMATAASKTETAENYIFFFICTLLKKIYIPHTDLHSP